MSTVLYSVTTVVVLVQAHLCVLCLRSLNQSEMSDTQTNKQTGVGSLSEGRERGL